MAARGKRGKVDKDVPPVELPPTVDDTTVSAAERRLAALRALDELQLRLSKSPRDPDLHYSVALVHLYSLDNVDAAARHLCRAVLEAPRVAVYRHTLRAAWMRPEQEKNLELSLSPRERLLPWKSMQNSAQMIRGVEPEARAATFENMLKVAHVFRGYRRLPRDKGLKPIEDLVASLSDWAGGDKSLWVAVIVQKRHAKRISHLFNRARADVPTAVWPALTRGQRPMIFSRGAKSLPGMVEVIDGSLRDIRITIALASGRRLLFLDGQKKKAGPFDLRYWAATPPSVQIPLSQPSESSSK